MLTLQHETEDPFKCHEDSILWKFSVATYALWVKDTMYTILAIRARKVRENYYQHADKTHNTSFCRYKTQVFWLKFSQSGELPICILSHLLEPGAPLDMSPNNQIEVYWTPAKEVNRVLI